ncbi:hypothetical protein HWB76_gp129 [Streptomyces phage Blueeyedbeauty]|uniref:Uncharacterized protein n=1 Tax=Streptomyces phage Blueeyedbeauty TaxID=2250336 RepID=A0A345L1X1_9CAUD|nr:hypothetical protein HWB76_gp129 [Streptomyces phage Blueeyedbeauty]AXH49273.1 hypothetical protein SEA_BLUEEYEDBEAUTY_157 [Streptomyces phage Blueeyedbeauty]
MAKTKWVPVGNRMMDRAYLRDGNVVHTGEALLLALLFHAKGKTKRGNDELKQVSKMLDDPNLNNKRTPRRKK